MEYYKNLSLESIVYFCEIDNCEKTEQWKVLKEFDSLYAASDLGRIKSLSRIKKIKCGFTRKTKDKIMTCFIQNGRGRVTLTTYSYQCSKEVHQLIAIAFLNHVPDRYNLIVDHINNNPLDNRLVNLQITSQRINSSKDRKNKTSKYTGVSVVKRKHCIRWLSYIRVNGINYYLGAFKKEIDARNEYNFVLKNIGSERETEILERYAVKRPRRFKKKI